MRKQVQVLYALFETRRRLVGRSLGWWDTSGLIDVDQVNAAAAGSATVEKRCRQEVDVRDDRTTK